MTVAHDWNVTVKEATEIQKSLRDSIRLVPLTKRVETIAGADISFNRFSNDFYAGMLVLSYPDLEPIERALERVTVDFPYVPGYLSFREVPALTACFEKLRHKPDVVMMDGQGIAHPRRLGVGAHLGLAIDAPVFGCAKSRLYGDGAEPGAEPGSFSLMRDPKSGDAIGAYVRTKARSKPVIISPGHKITLEESIALALSCVRGYRLPEPTRRTHDLVNAFRRGEIASE